jgi:hypothetical protein
MRENNVLCFAVAFLLLVGPVVAGDFADGVADPMNNLDNWTVLHDQGTNIQLNGSAGLPPGCVEFTADNMYTKLLAANGATSGDDIEIECDFYLNEGSPGNSGANGIIFGMQTGMDHPNGYMVVYDYAGQQFVAQAFNGWVPISDWAQPVAYPMADRTWHRWKVTLNYAERKATLYVNGQLVSAFTTFSVYTCFRTGWKRGRWE